MDGTESARYRLDNLHTDVAGKPFVDIDVARNHREGIPPLPLELS